MAVGGAAYLVSKAIKSSRVVAFADLGMEAIYEFEVKDMPVTVAVDVNGHFGAPDRSARMAGEDRQDSGDDRRERVTAVTRGRGGHARRCARPISPRFPRARSLEPRHVQWRASPHCMVVNLVRSGRKQPQLFSASAGVRLATPMNEASARGGRLSHEQPAHRPFDNSRRGQRDARTRPQVAPQEFRGTGRPGARRARAHQCAHAEAAAPRLSSHRDARRGQDHARAHHRQGAELRNRASPPRPAASAAPAPRSTPAASST